jgi:hypothetical protein
MSISSFYLLFFDFAKELYFIFFFFFLDPFDMNFVVTAGSNSFSSNNNSITS